MERGRLFMPSNCADFGPAVVWACAGVRIRRKLTPTFTQEDLMASRRPTEPPRSPEVAKEIPKVIKAEEKVAPTAPPRTRAKAATSRARKTPSKAPLRVTINEDVRRAMIAEGAYLRAERRGFAPGHEEEDWLAAEAEVNALLQARHGSTSQ
jgi:Protein of unknown function (DUF2934)